MSIYEFDAKQYEGWIREEGRGEGDLYRLISQVQKKVRRNKDFSVIVDELESDAEEIRPIYEAVLKYGPDLPPEELLRNIESVTMTMKEIKKSGVGINDEERNLIGDKEGDN